MHSYHIFYFPFKWEVQGRENLLFSEQVDLSKIPINTYNNWERNPRCMSEKEEDELYNEKNYYYQFIHSVLYDTGKDDSIVYHYERKETKEQEVSYIIQTKGKEYRLKLDTLNMNLYSSGVGMLFFFLQNDNYPDKEDVLKINQFGRRLFPPFMADIQIRSQIADSITIEGLNGVYAENFVNYQIKREPWNPALFIKKLITDLSEELRVTPVIDDRMFVNCWYFNNDINYDIKNNPNYHIKNDFWYKYMYVDSCDLTCQNDGMYCSLLRKQSYLRWQKYGTLYGVSRYSFVGVSDGGDFSRNVVSVHMRTIYVRMVELVLIAKASVLRFSREVTEVSNLTRTNTNNDVLIRRISSLYKEYILFINQMYFKELTIQDQGIELYNLMKETFKLDEYVKDLDNEIEELHNYMMLLEDNRRNTNAANLNKLVAVLTAGTVFIGLFDILGWKIALVGAAAISAIYMMLTNNRKK